MRDPQLFPVSGQSDSAGGNAGNDGQLSEIMQTIHFQAR